MKLDSATVDMLRRVCGDKTLTYVMQLKNGRAVNTHYFEVGTRDLPLRDDADTYYGVHPVLSAIRENGHYKRPQTSDIASVRCFFADFDASDWPSLRELVNHIQSLKYQPQLIVRTGGGFHCYWLFDEPIVCKTADKDYDNIREYLQYAQQGWVAYVCGDRHARDLARMLRFPGTSNYKYQPPRPVRIDEVRDGRAAPHSANEIVATGIMAYEEEQRAQEQAQQCVQEIEYAPVPKGMPSRVQDRMLRIMPAFVSKQQEGNRNNALYWAACRMAERHVPLQDALSALIPAAQRIGLKYSESAATIKSAYKR